MIDIVDKIDCCGCSACVQICPQNCIAMEEDDEGFLYPKVYVTDCVDCGLCEKVCPVINRFSSSHVQGSLHVLQMMKMYEVQVRLEGFYMKFPNLFLLKEA